MVLDSTLPLTDTQADEATKTVRELIRFESELLHQRLTWLIQIQGLLFTALAFAWKEVSLFFVGLLSALGIATAVSIALALLLYSPAVRNLHAWWRERLTDQQQDIRLVIGYWKPSERIGWLLRPWRALPVVFVVAWLFVLVIAFGR